MKTKILIILCVVILAACKKDKKENEPVVEQKTYIKKQITSQGTNTWNYDAQNRLNTMQFASINEVPNPSYTYKASNFNNNGDINDALTDYISAIINDIKEINTYNADGNLIRVNFIDNVTGASQGYRTQEYTGNQIKLTNYNASNTINSSTLYTKSADGKNVVELKFYTSAGTLSGTTTYSNFDNKKNIQTLYPKGWSTGIKSENNYQTETYTPASTGITANYTYTYEYNEDGYVTKRIAASGAFISYEYIKK